MSNRKNKFRRVQQTKTSSSFLPIIVGLLYKSQCTLIQTRQKQLYRTGKGRHGWVVLEWTQLHRRVLTNRWSDAMGKARVDSNSLQRQIHFTMSASFWQTGWRPPILKTDLVVGSGVNWRTSGTYECKSCMFEWVVVVCMSKLYYNDKQLEFEGECLVDKR